MTMRNPPSLNCLANSRNQGLMARQWMRNMRPQNHDRPLRIMDDRFNHHHRESSWNRSSGTRSCPGNEDLGHEEDSKTSMNYPKILRDYRLLDSAALTSRPLNAVAAERGWDARKRDDLLPSRFQAHHCGSEDMVWSSLYLWLIVLPSGNS